MIATSAGERKRGEDREKGRECWQNCFISILIIIKHICELTFVIVQGRGSHGLWKKKKAKLAKKIFMWKIKAIQVKYIEDWILSFYCNLSVI